MPSHLVEWCSWGSCWIDPPNQLRVKNKIQCDGVVIEEGDCSEDTIDGREKGVAEVTAKLLERVMVRGVSSVLMAQKGRVMSLCR